MTKEKIWNIYSNLIPTDKKAVDALLHRPAIKQLLEERVKTIFEPTGKISSHDMNVLTNIFINTRQSLEKIEEFIKNDEPLEKIDGCVLNKTSSIEIAKDLFYFKPTIGNNPMGNGEFLLSFYFPNVKKRAKSGDLIIGDSLYELKSSKNSSSGGGKVNSSKNGVYGVPDSVATDIMRSYKQIKDKNHLNLNHVNMSKITEYDVHAPSIFGAIIHGIFPKVKNKDIETLGELYDTATQKPSRTNSRHFATEFAKFQLRYYLDNHNEHLLFINRDTGNLLEVTKNFSDNTFKKLKVKYSFSMKSKTNNVYQFSIK